MTQKLTFDFDIRGHRYTITGEYYNRWATMNDPEEKEFSIMHAIPIDGGPSLDGVELTDDEYDELLMYADYLVWSW